MATVYTRSVFQTTAQEPREIGRAILLDAGAHAKVSPNSYRLDASLVNYGDVVCTGTREIRENGVMVKRFAYEKVWLLADLPDGGTAINNHDFAAGQEVRVVAGDELSC